MNKDRFPQFSKSKALTVALCVIFTLTRVLVILVMPLLLGCPAQCRDETFVLSQTTHGLGRLIVLLHTDAVKVQKVQNGYFLLCKAPDWDVIIFDPRSRTICRRSFADFEKRGLFSGMQFVNPAPLLNVPCIKAAKAQTYLGVKATKFTVPWQFNRGKPVASSGRSKEFLMAPEMTADRHIFQFLRRLYGVPVPLDCALLDYGAYGHRQTLMLSRRDAGPSWIKELSTNEIRRVPYKSSDFAVPANYKTCSDRDILLGENANFFEDMLPEGGH